MGVRVRVGEGEQAVRCARGAASRAACLGLPPTAYRSRRACSLLGCLVAWLLRCLLGCALRPPPRRPHQTPPPPLKGHNSSHVLSSPSPSPSPCVAPCLSHATCSRGRFAEPVRRLLLLAARCPPPTAPCAQLPAPPYLPCRLDPIPLALT
jgi:hypothetical protein